MILYKKYEVISALNSLYLATNPARKLSTINLSMIIFNGRKRFSQLLSYLKEKASRAIISASIYIRQAAKGQLPVNRYLKVVDTWKPSSVLFKVHRLRQSWVKPVVSQDKMMKLWPWLNMLPANNIQSKIYRELANLSRQGHNTWAGRVINAISKYTVNSPCHTNDINIFVNTVRRIRYNQLISDL